MNCCSYDLGELVKYLKVISDETRLKIICSLKNGRLCVCELQEILGKSHNLVLHHLKKLEKSGLVSHTCCGKHTYYNLENSFHSSLVNQLFTILSA